MSRLRGFNDHFSERATDYARSRPHYPAELVAFIAGLAPRKGCVWEAGCGSGQLTRMLAPHFDYIAATDASPEQLLHAPHLDRVSWMCTLVEECALADALADLIVAAAAAHWFDLPRFYREVRRVGRPDARIALFTYSFACVNPEVDVVLADLHAHMWARGYWPPERALVDSGYATLPFPFAPLETPDFAINARWTLAEMLAYMDTLSGMQAMANAESAAVLEFRNQMHRAWDGPATARSVTWPISLKAGLLR